MGNHLIKTAYLGGQAAIALNELLKEKRATIEPFSLEEAQAIGSGWEIEM